MSGIKPYSSQRCRLKNIYIKVQLTRRHPHFGRLLVNLVIAGLGLTYSMFTKRPGHIGFVATGRPAIKAIFLIGLFCTVSAPAIQCRSISIKRIATLDIAHRLNIQPNCCEKDDDGPGRVNPGFSSLYVSRRGSDRNDGRTSGLPLRTISKAMEMARAGTTVYIEDGTYFEQITTQVAGSRAREVVLTSYNGTATIDGSKLNWIPGSNQNQALVELRHPFIILRNIRITDSKNTGVLLAADNLRVENCEIVRSQRHGISTDTRRQTRFPGLQATMIKNVAIEGNTVDRAVLKGNGFGQGISVIANGFQVRRNTVRHTLTEGIDIWLGAKNGDVSENIVHNNLSPGIYIDGASDVRVHRNRVFNNLKGIGVASEDVNYSTNRITVDNNLIYDNREAGLFIWDSPITPGIAGAQNVIFEKNTIVNNQISIYLSGTQNSAEIRDNIGYSTKTHIFNNSTESSYNIRNNLWLDSMAEFLKTAKTKFPE